MRLLAPLLLVGLLLPAPSRAHQKSMSYSKWTLTDDGSFTYDPDPGFVGQDSFTYHAHDGALDSNVVTVTIEVTAVPGAGRVPDQSGWSGTPLTVDKRVDPPGDLQLSWDISCIEDDDDYAVYEGTLGNFDSHTRLTCTTGGATTSGSSCAGRPHADPVRADGAVTGG